MSESFAILRGTTNKMVAEVMDSVMPNTHSYKAHFKLLAHHGEFQENRDLGNESGGIVGKGYRIDLGACDHNYDGENTSGVGPSPRTNGGIKCFDAVTGITEIDSAREDLRMYFGCLMDAVQLIVDKIREEHGYKRIYDDIMRDHSFAEKLRKHVNAKYSRAEVSSNFVTLMDGHDGCSFHKDTKNCAKPSYDWTCCTAITVHSESTNRLYRAVTNLNSREACGRAMGSELKYTNFKIQLDAEMERINSSYLEIYGKETADDVPTAKTYTDLYLNDDLPWVGEMDEQGTILKYMKAASAPSRDYFLSAATSAIYNLQLKEVGLSCHSMVGLLLIAMYMNRYQHFHAIVGTITKDSCLFKKMQTDLPGTYLETSDILFPNNFWGGKHPRFSPSGFNFKEVFVENQFNFELAVRELKELLKLVNTCDDRKVVTAKIKEMAANSNLPGLAVFRLQLFLPLAALCGLILPQHLFHADYIEPAADIENGSFTTLNAAGFDIHRHQDALLNICGQVGLPRRHSLGECLTCESHRRLKRHDLFLHGQDLFHHFLIDTVYSVKRKRYNFKEWENISFVSQLRLQEENCG